jgi:hypothetical protein
LAASSNVSIPSCNYLPNSRMISSALGFLNSSCFYASCSFAEGPV